MGGVSVPWSHSRFQVNGGSSIFKHCFQGCPGYLVRKWVKRLRFEQGNLQGSGLRVRVHTFTHIPLTRAQTHSHTARASGKCRLVWTKGVWCAVNLSLWHGRGDLGRPLDSESGHPISVPLLAACQVLGKPVLFFLNLGFHICKPGGYRIPNPSSIFL